MTNKKTNYFSFASCDEHRVYCFLRLLYPHNQDKITKENVIVEEFLNLIKKDIIRLQDPAMHGNRCVVLPGSNWEKKCITEDKMVEICSNLHDEFNK